MAHRQPDGAVEKLTIHEFVAWLQDTLDSSSPAAAVRFGDGESEMLEAVAAEHESVSGARARIKRQTGQTLATEDLHEIGRAVARGFDQADVLGLPGKRGTRLEGVDSENPLAARYAMRTAAEGCPPLLANSIFHHEILKELPRLLAGRRVSVISCRDVKPVLEERWGLEDVAVYQIPSQHSRRNEDGQYEAAMHDVPFWPDAYDRVIADLTVRERGEVFMIGAGVLGKSLCIEVRQRGGIALDMGSALDSIVGRLTRAWVRRAIELHLDGTPVDEIVADLQGLSGGKIDRDQVVEFIETIAPYATDA